MTSVIGRGALGLIVALLLMGVAAVAVEAQSPTRLYLTGARVAAYSEGGIVFYRYGDQGYTLDDERRSARDVEQVPVTVFVDRGDPSQALVDGPGRWVDAALVGVWFVAALLVLPFARVRQRRRRQRQAEFAAGDRRLESAS